MAYSIEHDEAAGAAIARIVREQIARAREQLMDRKAPIEKRVHDARKRFKEIRAVLRLVREPFGAQFDVENAWYRDAGRTLASARDADAVLEALGKLGEAKPLPRATLWRLRRLLKKRRASKDELSRHIDGALALLQTASDRIDSWPALADSFDSVADGLARTYRNGRRAMTTATATRLPDDFHEWRKRVKEHWYHVQLLRHVWPDVMKPYASVMETLSKTLGDHHDLTVLRSIVATESRHLGRRTFVVAMLDAIADRQLELEREAETIGARVYAEPARKWLARMSNYWSTWRGN
jgi:CHAD domain-containing protein